MSVKTAGQYLFYNRRCGPKINFEFFKTAVNNINFNRKTKIFFYAKVGFETNTFVKNVKFIYNHCLSVLVVGTETAMTRRLRCSNVRFVTIQCAQLALVFKTLFRGCLLFLQVSNSGSGSIYLRAYSCV